MEEPVWVWEWWEKYWFGFEDYWLVWGEVGSDEEGWNRKKKRLGSHVFVTWRSRNPLCGF